MARDYRDDEYNNSPAFGDEYIDYDDEPSGEENEYEENAEWSEEDEAGAEYQDDAEYEDEAEYDEESAYDDEELYDDDQSAEEDYDDGSNYSIFKRLNRENDEEEDGEEQYEDEYDEGEEEYYDEDAEEPADDEEEFGGEKNGKLTAIIDRLASVTDNDYIMWALLILLPPVGLLLMFYTKRWDTRKRSIWLVVALICLLIEILLLLPSGKSNDPVASNDDFGFNQFTAAPTSVTTAVPGVQTATPAPSGSEEATPVPSTTVHTIAEATENAGVTYVYATNSGVYYHTLSDCGGITNASKITIDAALGRNLSPCPDCAGGNNGTTDPSDTSTTYYATTGGKYYHVNATCSGMTNASITTISAATVAGKTACPVCIGYYGTAGGKYYYSISNCSGMTNAQVKTLSEWTSSGKTACPICMGDGKSVTGTSVPTETQVFATTGGTFFHTKSDCSGMKNASQSTISRAVNMGKSACATCVKPANIYVFATSGGSYYHTSSTCSGMKNAQYITAETAIKYGKTACPTCAKMLTGVKGFGTSTSGTGTGTATTGATSTYVYCTTGGTYFHTESGCSGMTGAKKVTYANAVSAGKKACPTCVKASKLTVFCTSGGTYYHTNSTCSGMTGATAMTAQKAISYGKKACPTCAKALSTASAASDGKTQVASVSTGVTTPVWSNLSEQVTLTASANSTVYIDLSGESSYYHLIAKCPVMNFYNGHAVTLEYALCGYDACPACNPPSKVTV